MLMSKFYKLLDSAGIPLDLFCRIYKIDVTELVEEGQDVQGKVLDFIARMEIQDEDY